MGMICVTMKSDLDAKNKKSFTLHFLLKEGLFYLIP